MNNGTGYNSAIYEPFRPTLPSEQTTSKLPKMLGGIKRTEIIIDLDGTDDPDYGKSEQCPVGEPWIMAVFALLFAGGIYLRTWKRQYKKEKYRKNKQK